MVRAQDAQGGFREVKKSYWQKLKDPKWQKKRLEILERDKFTCQLCGETEKELHVHHFAYKSSGNPWDIDNKDLTTLCCDCHERIESALTLVRLAIQHKPALESFENIAKLWIKRTEEGVDAALCASGLAKEAERLPVGFSRRVSELIEITAHPQFRE